jgi:hypothetical protein
MMVQLLGPQRHAAHEGEGGVEVGEPVAPEDRFARPLRAAPTRQVRQRSLDADAGWTAHGSFL